MTSSYSDTDDQTLSSLSDIQRVSTALGPFGIDPLHFTTFLFVLLTLYVSYLFLPRGFRVKYFGAYPKRYAWSTTTATTRQYSDNASLPSVHTDYTTRGGSIASNYSASQSLNSNHHKLQAQQQGTIIIGQQQQQPQFLQHHHNLMDLASAVGTGVSGTDEIAISATMQLLRDTGMVLTAHGSKGKPKRVRLQLTESSITWRTVSTIKGKKVGKAHHVPLTHIMYVDVGKQTTALRRVENASVPEGNCFSLLTKDGSLDLEANGGVKERDALVACFSLVLDEVHCNENVDDGSSMASGGGGGGGKGWRNVQRTPSSDMPSSFDEYDRKGGGGETGEV